ncbi:MAG: putative AlkP superfamily pyrophosphatase or phosphodiesterase [Cryomorphaceae bacterium]|jgi:predicted AlkP superfamily pyrophosphatase or phosphodiesterase
MMNRVAVLDVVGLTQGLIGDFTPRIKAFVEAGQLSAFKPAFPAVTCTAQSSYLTGLPVEEHGVVANGWYDREAAEVKFWKQSNHIVKGEKIWEKLRKVNPDFTCAKLFWWYNMYSSADWTITPRPAYPASGRKVFDVYSQPMGMKEEIKSELGNFPFPSFWGPNAGIASSQWIADSAKWVEREKQPTLSLVYLPHLDYCLQQYGPDLGDERVSVELGKIDTLVGELLDFYAERDVEVMLLSEYGISAVDEPVHLNRLFREKGWITIKDELGLEMLDCGASKVFAVADHQVAHVYINDASLMQEVRELLASTGGVDEVRAAEGYSAERAGDLVVVSKSNAWFSYYYWLDDALAPDFARCVDIHRKVGYDPVELFLDPELKFPKLSIAKFLLMKKLGFRALLEVIPLDASLVKGSHGRDNVPVDERPIFVTQGKVKHEAISRPEEVADRIMQRVLGEGG